MSAYSLLPYEDSQQSHSHVILIKFHLQSQAILIYRISIPVLLHIATLLYVSIGTYFSLNVIHIHYTALYTIRMSIRIKVLLAVRGICSHCATFICLVRRSNPKIWLCRCKLNSHAHLHTDGGESVSKFSFPAQPNIKYT